MNKLNREMLIGIHTEERWYQMIKEGKEEEVIKEAEDLIGEEIYGFQLVKKRPDNIVDSCLDNYSTAIGGLLYILRYRPNLIEKRDKKAFKHLKHGNFQQFISQAKLNPFRVLVTQHKTTQGKIADTHNSTQKMMGTIPFMLSAMIAIPVFFEPYKGVLNYIDELWFGIAKFELSLILLADKLKINIWKDNETINTVDFIISQLNIESEEKQVLREAQRFRNALVKGKENIKIEEGSQIIDKALDLITNLAKKI